MKTGLALLLLTFASLASAQDLSQMERILVPIVTTADAQGLNGARFGSAFDFVNFVTPLHYFPRYTAGVAAIGEALPPDYQFPFLGAGAAPSRIGRLLFVDPSASTAFEAELTSWTGDEGAVYRTRLPVVHERDFRIGTAEIIGVHSDYLYSNDPACRTATPQYRHTLRVYDVDARGDASVTVRVYYDALRPSYLVRELTLPLVSREGTDASFPAYAEIPLEEFCNPFSCHTPCRGGELRVEIEPVTSGLRYWAMVSATDNVTAQVSLAYPQ